VSDLKVSEAVVRAEVVEFSDKYKLIEERFAFSFPAWTEERALMFNKPFVVSGTSIMKSVDKGFCFDILFVHMAKASSAWSVIG